MYWKIKFLTKAIFTFGKIGNHPSSHLNIFLFCFVSHGGTPGGLDFTHIRHSLAYFSNCSWLNSSMVGDRSFFICEGACDRLKPHKMEFHNPASWRKGKDVIWSFEFKVILSDWQRNLKYTQLHFKKVNNLIIFVRL